MNSTKIDTEIISKKKKTISCHKKLLDVSSPLIMGILNITPDSFYDGGRYQEHDTLYKHVEEMLSEGAHIIDIGAVSTRPNAQFIAVEEEINRLKPILSLLRDKFPEAILSVDTCWAQVAEVVADCGADIINDISGGQFDNEMFDTIARINLPYIMMHTQGMPHEMQKAPIYNDIIGDLSLYFSERLNHLYRLGVKDVIIDPGFGFGKTIAHNFELLQRLDELRLLFEEPILVGLSRKSMIWKTLDTDPQHALNGTTVLNTIALQNGADILRVHDVREAVECVRLNEELRAKK